MLKRRGLERKFTAVYTMATLAPASRTSSACFPLVIPPVAKTTFPFSGTKGAVSGEIEEGGGDGDGVVESAGVEGNWSIWVEEESAGDGSEPAVSEVKELLRAGMRMSGWDLEAFSASAVSGLRFAESRTTVASILADVSADVAGFCGTGRS